MSGGESKLLTAKVVGERWGRSPLSVLRDARLGRLPAIRIGARTVRFRPADVLAFEARHLDGGREIAR